MSPTPVATPLVSILVPAYNHAPYIEECLAGLINQECDFEYEIVVGEDHSTDDTRARIMKIAEKHPRRFRLFLREANIGAMANFRNLLDESKGKYITICEGDDYWHRNDKLRRQVEILESDPKASLVCTDADAYFQNTGRRIKSIHERNGQWRTPPEDQTLGLLTRRINIFTCSVCLPRTNYLKILEENPFEFSTQQPMGDIQLWIESSLLGKVVPIRESFVTYRVITESASHSKDPEKLFSFQEAALVLAEHYVKKLNYDALVLYKVRMNHLWGMIHITFQNNDESLRGRLFQIISSRSMVPTGDLERLAVYALENESRMKRFRTMVIAALRIMRIQNKFRSLFSLIKYRA